MIFDQAHSRKFKAFVGDRYGKYKQEKWETTMNGTTIYSMTIQKNRHFGYSERIIMNEARSFDFRRGVIL